ncbi:CG42486 [Drosophila busckii]|uniref:CG42486 n=1 Tax=Drosophila busckii TaxID=30019 RepID=A0A0M4ECI6_DROBS|nr:SPARC [Drosophila busckii]ALC39347.1 CG42486 [Drosophila busckii]
MKCLAFCALLLFVLAAFSWTPAEGSFCPCNLGEKGQVCGTNGVTYKNRCEFECTQRDYKKLNRQLNIKNMGPC